MNQPIFAYSNVKESFTDVWSLPINTTGFACECVCPKCASRLSRIRESDDVLFFQHPKLQHESDCDFGYWQSIAWAAEQITRSVGRLVLPPIEKDGAVLQPVREICLSDHSLDNVSRVEIIFKTPDGIVEPTLTTPSHEHLKLLIDLSVFQNDYLLWWEWGSVFDLLHDVVCSRIENRQWLFRLP